STSRFHTFGCPGWFRFRARLTGRRMRSRAVSRLADFFLFHQAQVTADVEAEVPGEKYRHALDVQRAVGEVGAGVRRALHDPDLARAAVRVVQAPAVAHGRDVVGAAVDEEQGARLERAQHGQRAAVRE